jgi:predicted membrane-bound spermidine synthase
MRVLSAAFVVALLVVAPVSAIPTDAYAGGYYKARAGGCPGCYGRPKKIIRSSKVVHHRKVVAKNVVIPRKRVVDHHHLILHKRTVLHRHHIVHKRNVHYRDTIVHRHNYAHRHVVHHQHQYRHTYQTHHRRTVALVHVRGHDCGCNRGFGYR